MAMRRRFIHDYEPGARVWSDPVGSCPAFAGTVVARVRAGFNVRDAQGRLWMREARELQPLAAHHQEAA